MAPFQQPPPAQQAMQLTHADRPEISETFVDSLWRVSFENMVVKMELTVNRVDDPNPPAAPTGRAMTACRLVMPITGMIDMLGKLQAVMAQLQAAGVVTPISNPPTSGRPN